MSPSAEILVRALLSGIPGLGPVRLKRMFAEYQSGQRIWNATRREWAAFEVPSLCWRSKESLDLAGEMRKLRLELDEYEVGMIGLGDKRYSPLLEQIYAPPLVLFYQGDLSLLTEGFPLAVVGTRRASREGLDLAFRYSNRLAKDGVIIISGLAIGIDGSAHRGALEAGGQTIAVLGGGHGRLYPPKHRGLAKRILESGGLIISEYRPTAPAVAAQFKARNRIIAGLSHGVLVVEAPAKSGSIITATMALEENREVFAIPGSVNDPNWIGSLKLLRTGAVAVYQEEQIYESFQHLPIRLGVQDQLMLLPDEEAVVRLVAKKRCSLESISTELDLAWGDCVYILSELQIKKIIALSPEGQITPGPFWTKASACLQKE